MAKRGLDNLAKRLQTFPEQWARESVKRLQTAVKPSLARATGGDNKLSGVGAKLNTTSSVETGANTTIATFAAGPKRNRGPWTWLERGTRNRPQGGSSPARRTWSQSIEPELERIKQDAAKRFHDAVRG